MKGKILPHLGTLILKLVLCLALVLPLWLLIGTTAHSAEGDVVKVDSIPGYSVYIDGDNNICIETYDRERVSSIYYKTLAFTISRCAPGEARLINGEDPNKYKRGDTQDAKGLSSGIGNRKPAEIATGVSHRTVWQGVVSERNGTPVTGRRNTGRRNTCPDGRASQ